MLAHSRSKLSRLESQIENFIKLGHHGRARSLLLLNNSKKIKRQDIARIADLARRLNMPRYAAKILRPLVRSNVKPKATVQEQALFANALTRLSLYDEAREILSQLDTAENPQVLFFQGQNYMREYRYSEAVPKILDYIRTDRIEPYARLVGFINLLSCYVATLNFIEAYTLLDQIEQHITEMENSGFPNSLDLVRANVFELRSEAYLYAQKYAEAERAAEEGLKFLVHGRSRYELYLKRLKATTAILQNPNDQVALTNFHNIRQLCFDLKNYDEVRQCDFYLAVATRNDELFRHVLLGTAAESLKKRMKALYSPNVQEPQDWLWNMGDVLSTRVFDFRSGKEEDGRADLTKLPILYKLFAVLCRDAYSSIPLEVIFAKLYPQEYFDPNSSLSKIRQDIERLKKWFKNNDVPLTIKLSDGQARLVCHGSYAVRMTNNLFLGTNNELLFSRLKTRLPGNEFSNSEAQIALGISLRSTQRLLQWAVEIGKVERLSIGRTHFFKFRDSK